MTHFYRFYVNFVKPAPVISQRCFPGFVVNPLVMLASSKLFLLNHVTLPTGNTGLVVSLSAKHWLDVPVTVHFVKATNVYSPVKTL